MFNNITKLYELQIARTFWMIEKVNKNQSILKDDSLSLGDISDIRNKFFGNNNNKDNQSEDLF